MIEKNDTSVKKMLKLQNPWQEHLGNLRYNEKNSNLRIVEIEGEEFQLHGPENIFNKIVKENIPNLKKEMTISIQEAYRTPIRQDRKENPLAT